MVEYANGLPLVMQEIGLSIFYKAALTKTVTYEKAVEGLFDSTEDIGKRLILPYFEEYESRKEYKSLLLKIAQFYEFKFKISDVEKILTLNEKNVLNDFIEICMELSMLKIENDEYIISNNLLITYFKLLTFKNSY